jgi:glycosyltransferase involved in cell wall biosynthesis
LDIGIVVHYFDRSEGTGGYAVELATRFAREHRVTIYAAGVRAPVPESATVVHVPALRGRAYLTILSFPPAFAAVRRRHDVIHAQGWVANRADVVTAHIVLAAWREKAGAAGIRPPVGERWLGRFVSRREARLYRTAGAVIAPSGRARSDIARLYGRNERVRVIPHGFVNPPVAPSRSDARAALGLPLNGFVALYVGDARKGLGPALEAVAATRYVQLLVLSASRRAAYDAIIQRLGIGNRVHWLGHAPDPASAYVAADVLLHPTIYDTFGLVVAEAAAHGLPAIVSRTAGASELFRHGESAWLLDAPSATETAVALASVSQDASLRTRLGHGARAVAATRSWDDVAEETLVLYQTLVRQ